MFEKEVLILFVESFLGCRVIVDCFKWFSGKVLFWNGFMSFDVLLML